jgi:hypothetical protein
MPDLEDIPQIKPEEAEGYPARPKQDNDSIFIPKIEPNRHKAKTSSDKRRKIFKILGLAGLSLLIFVAISGFLFFRVYKRGMAVYASVQSIVAAAQSQNLPQIKSELQNTKVSLSNLQGSYKSVAWMKFIPFLGTYVSDGEHALNAATYGMEAAEILVVTVEPYADIIGFAPDGQDEPESGQETTQDRLDFVIKTIPDIIPKADELSLKVAAIQNEVEQIDPDRYPETFAGRELRSKIQRGKELVDLTAQLVTNGKPLLEVAPYLMGTKGPRTYLILFQNDKELRPTGGFMTAYAIATVEKGKFEPVASSDIYNLDAKYFATQRASSPIITYLKGPYLISKNYRLRDLNWSPDFAESMDLFVKEIEKVGIRDIDGIIAVDTQLLVNLLDVIGPIGVSGFGNFSNEIISECNCPQVIYELESFADIEGPIVWSQDEPGKIIFAPPNIDNRKKIIGPLMNSILANALGQPKDKLPALFAAAFKSLTEKHVLFYMLDDEAQKGVESFGIAGRIKDYEGDYLHINDANLGGRKSNLYVTQEVVQAIEIAKDGTVEKTVTITYKNPEKYDGWLNSVLPNWVRIYVPKESELIAFEGVEDKEEPYEELGKTVFAGFFELRPQGVSRVTVKYRLPFKVDGDEYKLLIQKQPGTDAPLYSINIRKQASGPVGPTARREEELFLRTDKEFKFKI